MTTTDQQRLSAIQADARKIIARANYNHCVSGGDYLAGAVMQSLAAAGFAITPKPEALSREGGEFDEAGAWADAANKWPTFSKHLIENYRDSYITGWGHCARIAHADREALKAELTQARERIAELEAANEKLRRCLLPAYLAMAEHELIDEPMPDNAVMLSFMGSGASDQVTAGEIRAALATTTAPIAEEKADG